MRCEGQGQRTFQGSMSDRARAPSFELAMVAPNHWTANKTTEFREGLSVGLFDRVDRVLGFVGQSHPPRLPRTTR